MCKFKSKIQSCLCPRAYECYFVCRAQPKHKPYKDHTDDSYNFFDILAHNVPDCSRKQKQIRTLKRNTTYGADYCPKRPSSPIKINVPYPAIFISDKKMSRKTTHKTDFKHFTEADKKILKHKVVTHKSTLSCPKGQFTGTSETKSSFVNPSSIKLSIEERLLNQRLKKKSTSSENPLVKAHQPFESSTTYSSSYKKPKNVQKTKCFVPKSEQPQIFEPYHPKSQYKEDFKRPNKTKRRSFKKVEKYSPPDEPMENKTTYKLDFTPKPLEKKKGAKRTGSFSNKKCLCDQNTIHCKVICKPKVSSIKNLGHTPCMCNAQNDCCEKENEIPAC